MSEGEASTSNILGDPKKSLLVMVVVLAFMGALRSMDKDEPDRKEVRIL